MNSPRTIVVGVTGHRPNRLPHPCENIARRLNLVLDAIRAGSPPHCRRIAVSPLAEGADRMFANEALALGYGLDAILPFKTADYVLTFANQATTQSFHSFLDRAHKKTELAGSLTDTSAAFEAVGRTVVEVSHILVAVWDGEKSAGRGGTPDVVSLALKAGKPVIWIDARTNRLPRRVKRISKGGAVISEPLTQRSIKALTNRSAPA